MKHSLPSFQVMLLFFGIPKIQPNTTLPLIAPNQRLESILILLANESNLLEYSWLNGRNFSSIVKKALDDIIPLFPFDKRPWGKGLRPNDTMDAIGNIFTTPVATIPAGQLPSVNGLCMITECGVISFYSSIPFGSSGLLLPPANGTEIIFGPHTKDQWPFYVSFTDKPAIMLFNSTKLCLANNGEGFPLWYLYWIVPCGAIVLILLVVIVRTLFSNRRGSYDAIANG